MIHLRPKKVTAELSCDKQMVAEMRKLVPIFLGGQSHGVPTPLSGASEGQAGRW